MIKNVKIMKMKFIYVVLVALLLGSQMTLSAQNRDNKEKKQRPTQEQMMQMQTNQMVRALMLDDATAAKFTPIKAVRCLIFVRSIIMNSARYFLKSRL